MQPSDSSLKAKYQKIRSLTESLCKPLVIEDYGIQSMEDVSPPKWHLAHTTWFFETFVLKPHLPDYQIFNQTFHYLFNSYYQRIGKPYPRDQRGLMSRPTVKEVYAYRQYVDDRILKLIDTKAAEVSSMIELGLHHEQQHQELLLTDIKFNFSVLSHNFPNYGTKDIKNIKDSNKLNIPLNFIEVEPCIMEVGHFDESFCFDNEKPRHKQILNSFAIANRLVTNGEYAEFISANGYQDPLWWLADGWDCLVKNNWQAPLYWFKTAENQWQIYTLHGIKAIDPLAPVVHVSYYEADAYARFRGYRLATEFEWESFVHRQKPEMTGNFLESAYYHPQAIEETNHSDLHQFFGDAWEWTCSAYCPYPGYQADLNALGEYNGKFMNNQIVLRGGSCVTPKSHIRASYRNFFQPEKRWQFSGIRLAKNI